MYNIDWRWGRGLGSKILSLGQTAQISQLLKKFIKMILSEFKGTVSVILSNPPYKDYNA